MATTSNKVSITKTQEGNDIYHYVQGLPKLNELNEQVKEVIATSSYWERHGYGLLEIGSAFPLLLLGLLMCSTETPILFIAGFLLLGCCHSVIANRLAHLAAHNSLFETKWPNRIARWLSIEMYGFFSERVAYEIHISQHHPYTKHYLHRRLKFVEVALPTSLYLHVLCPVFPSSNDSLYISEGVGR
ncbi:FADS6 [Bugula neritina]|uniref:FADS6 n=1 Tax=Bugula neritina TaxID=10212 RepID=A0A7J7JX01_BUGNE|nr:FADS6 [Bugula neritina]